jgi:hypothetical protein
MEVPSSLVHLIAINVEFRVVLCLSPLYRHAQTTKGIVYHMRNFHHEKPAIRKQLSEFVQDIISQDTQFSSYDSTNIQLPADGSIPQPVVPVVDGFSCRECRFLTISRDMIRKHANREHLKQRKRDKELFNSVRLQSWFGQKRERYWEVDESKERELDPEQEPESEREPELERERELEPEQERELEPELGQLGKLQDATAAHHSKESNESITIGVTINTKDAIDWEIEQWEAEATERRLAMQANPAYTELDSWLRFTKWHAVLSKSKHDMLKTYEFLQYAGPEETELHRLLLAWDRIRERALDTLESVDHKDALKWWVSPKNEVASQHPFELPDKSSTLTKYSRIWEQFICYMLRTAPAEFGDDTETGVVYTQGQWEAIRAIQETLEHDTTEHDTTEHDTMESDTTEHDTTEHDTMEHDTTEHDTTEHAMDHTTDDTTEHDTMEHDTTEHDTTEHAMGHTTDDTTDHDTTL